MNKLFSSWRREFIFCALALTHTHYASTSKPSIKSLPSPSFRYLSERLYRRRQARTSHTRIPFTLIQKVNTFLLNPTDMRKENGDSLKNAVKQLLRSKRNQTTLFCENEPFNRIIREYAREKWQHLYGQKTIVQCSSLQTEVRLLDQSLFENFSPLLFRWPQKQFFQYEFPRSDHAYIQNLTIKQAAHIPFEGRSYNHKETQKTLLENPYTTLMGHLFIDSFSIQKKQYPSFSVLKKVLNAIPPYRFKKLTKAGLSFIVESIENINKVHNSALNLFDFLSSEQFMYIHPDILFTKERVGEILAQVPLSYQEALQMKIQKVSYGWRKNMEDMFNALNHLPLPNIFTISNYAEFQKNLFSKIQRPHLQDKENKKTTLSYEFLSEKDINEYLEDLKGKIPLEYHLPTSQECKNLFKFIKNQNIYYPKGELAAHIKNFKEELDYLRKSSDKTWQKKYTKKLQNPNDPDIIAEEFNLQRKLLLILFANLVENMQKLENSNNEERSKEIITIQNTQKAFDASIKILTKTKKHIFPGDLPPLPFFQNMKQSRFYIPEVSPSFENALERATKGLDLFIKTHLLLFEISSLKERKK